MSVLENSQIKDYFVNLFVVFDFPTWKVIKCGAFTVFFSCLWFFDKKRLCLMNRKDTNCVLIVESWHVSSVCFCCCCSALDLISALWPRNSICLCWWLKWPLDFGRGDFILTWHNMILHNLQFISWSLPVRWASLHTHTDDIYICVCVFVCICVYNI